LETIQYVSLILLNAFTILLSEERTHSGAT
jgi:hypothetical protein